MYEHVNSNGHAKQVASEKWVFELIDECIEDI